VGSEPIRLNEMAVTKAIVTGGSGFLGRYVCKLLLERGYEVHSIARHAHDDMDKLGVTQSVGSITDANILDEAFQGAAVVFHTAALAGIWGDSRVYEQINIEGTRCVIDACKNNKIPHLVYTSSPSVIFDGEDQKMIDESVEYPSEYLCHYSRTKAEAEKMVLHANSEELKTLSLRPHLIWGKGDNHLIPRLLESAEKGKLKIIGDGRNQVDMVHVNNAAWSHIDAYDALLLGKGEGQAYFITNDEPVEMWQWLNDLLKRLGRKEITNTISENIAYKIATLFEWLFKIFHIKKDPPLTRFVVKQFCTYHTYNISKAKKDLNYTIRTSMDEGLKELLSSLE
jgi:2-alkyl-3-oxoalkanoate reductase